MKSRKKIFLILCTIVLCVACDQITKEIVKSRLPGMKPLTLVKGVLRLDYVDNKGGAFAFE